MVEALSCIVEHLVVYRGAFGHQGFVSRIIQVPVWVCRDQALDNDGWIPRQKALTPALPWSAAVTRSLGVSVSTETNERHLIAHWLRTESTWRNYSPILMFTNITI